MNYWLEVHWPLMDGTPRKELYVWFHEGEVSQLSKYSTGDRVVFYVTKKNPYPKGPKGAESIFATGTITGELEEIDIQVDKKRYIYRRKVDEVLFPEKRCWIHRKEANKLFEWSVDYSYQQACSLTRERFERLEQELQRRIDDSQRKRFFVINQADHPVSARYEDVEGEFYGFSGNVTGRKLLLEADSSARVIFYRTEKSSKNPKRYVSAADVEKISLIRPETWRAKLYSFILFNTPVARLADGNVQHSIREIDGALYYEILRQGGAAQLDTGAPSTSSPLAGASVLADAPVPERPIFGEMLSAPAGLVPPAPQERAISTETDDSVKNPAHGRRNRELDKLTEERAIHIVRHELHRKGWELVQDHQKKGSGFDLEYRRASEHAFVEVKGIRGSELTFNMTSKEWAMAIANRDYFVIAVTNVLTESHSTFILGQEKLFELVRTPTQFRLKKQT